jgi:hypothetical protein
MLTVRRSRAGDIEHCLAIVRELPDYFTDDVPVKVDSDLGAHPGWVAVDDRRVGGFAVVEQRAAEAAEIRARRQQAQSGRRLGAARRAG